MAERQGFEDDYNLLVYRFYFLDFRLFPHFFPFFSHANHDEN